MRASDGDGQGVAAVAVAMGRKRPPWNFTAFSLICRMTGRPACSAPATMASACSRVMTLNAVSPSPARCAAAMRSAVRASGIGMSFLVAGR
jgi:hypothetical protein